jgi:3-hydroxybutyrate dehydrogenase
MAGQAEVGLSPLLAGRRALVTGAASGIGLAIARHLAGLGAEVVLSDLPGDRLSAAVDGIPRAAGLPADLSLREDVHRLAADAGAVDILINNAGLQHVSPIEDFDEAKFDLIQAVMLRAPFLLTKALLPGMYERGWGRVINIASVHGLVASPYKSAYVAAKHGLVGITKAIALEAGARSPDVTVHAICPSYVRTPLVESQVADQARAHGIPEAEVIDKVLLAQNAVKRLIEPADVARAVEFLCSDMAWSMTGSALAMDAGWLAH